VRPSMRSRSTVTSAKPTVPVPPIHPRSGEGWSSTPTKLMRRFAVATTVNDAASYFAANRMVFQALVSTSHVRSEHACRFVPSAAAWTGGLADGVGARVGLAAGGSGRRS
jgi:hypothetical protein